MICCLATLTGDADVVRRPNVLLITLDQFRADCLSCAGHPVVRTPNLDRLAADGVRFANHFSQAAPCSPGRAALYTGTYQMNNRVVSNGTPLDSRFDNLALAARRAGYAPALFGYTDQGIDPRLATGPDDPRLNTYEGVLPGFDPILHLPTELRPWLGWLRELGYDLPDDPDAALATEPERPAEHGVSAFLTDHLITWIEQQAATGEPWFAHASFLRPHPPYAAAGEWSKAYDPAEVPLPVPPADDRHPLHDHMLQHPFLIAPDGEASIRALRAQYYGMISDVDHQMGRLRAALERLGQWDDTVVVVVADHGEQLGDQGLIEKAGFFEASYRVIALWRDPRRTGAHGTVVERFTENVDVFPTLCDAIGVDVPAQCDGVPLTPFLDGEEPPWWRNAAFYEWDWRDVVLAFRQFPWPWDRRPETFHLAVRRSADRAYVHFGDGGWRCFDLAADPSWRTEIHDPEVVLGEAQAMLEWRMNHLDRTMTGLLLQDGGIGRFPPEHPAMRPRDPVATWVTAEADLPATGTVDGD